MGHDVFISYSHVDQAVANAACARLEEAGHGCWIAPRDIHAGEWSKAIMAGIRGAKVFVLIFSANSNCSPQVIREVERAVNRGMPIIPFRIEDVPPSDSLEYFISSQQWMDALSPPVEQHLGRLVGSVGRLLGAPATNDLTTSVPSLNAASHIGRVGRIKAMFGPPWRVVLMVLGLVLTGTVLANLLLRPASSATCATEVMSNGSGATIDLANRTVRPRPNDQPVAIGAVARDADSTLRALRRLCEEKAEGTINGWEYRRRFDLAVEPLVERAREASGAAPIFTHEICMTALCDNSRFIDFADRNHGRVVRIHSTLDFSVAPSEAIIRACPTIDLRPASLFNAELILPAFNFLPYALGAEGTVPRPPPPEGYQFRLCGQYKLRISSNSPPPLGTTESCGTHYFLLDGFFRLRRLYRGGSEGTLIHLEEVPATVSELTDTQPSN